ncbi:hypothetical protein MG293_020830 [Ovis ammon polii]|uniref:Uncharacterized protein n=1 Tax=Ovis ammon polii TaxID=230172 RepID=A0AAD4TMD1_OVIAM|nr:hypothetical protein MG293_020830 [Ovis ammon polii]
MCCVAGTLQPPIVTPGEDATLFRVEAGEDGKAQVDGDVAGIRRGFQLLAEDIIEDVEVVAGEEQQQGSSLELEEKTMEEQCQERPGGPSELLALDVMQALATLNAQAMDQANVTGIVKLSKPFTEKFCRLMAAEDKRKHSKPYGSPAPEVQLTQCS